MNPEHSRTARSQRHGRRKVNKEIDNDISEGKSVKTQKKAKKTLGDAIDRYIAGSAKKIGRTKEQVLTTIRREYDISEMPCDQIKSHHIMEFV